MRVFVERFIFPILVATVLAALIGQLPLPHEWRFPIIAGLALVAAFAAWSIDDERRSDDKGRVRARLVMALAVVVSVMAIGLLVPFNRSSNATERLFDAGPARQGERVPPDLQERELKDTPRVPNQANGSGAPEPASVPANPVSMSIDSPQRQNSSKPTWAIVMYSDDGDDFPLLRAVAQAELARRDITVASIMKPSATVDARRQLFAASAATLSWLRAYCDGLIIGNIETHTIPNDQMEGMVTTHLTATVRVASTDGSVSRELLLNADGAGFSAPESRANAEQRAAEDFENKLAGIASKFPRPTAQETLDRSNPER